MRFEATNLGIMDINPVSLESSLSLTPSQFSFDDGCAETREPGNDRDGDNKIVIIRQ